MALKVLVPISGNEIAGRFDLAGEALIAEGKVRGPLINTKIVILPQASADELCHLVVKEGVNVVICGAIEEEYFQYLLWKKVKVLDFVVGEPVEAVKLLLQDKLKPGDILT